MKLSIKEYAAMCGVSKTVIYNRIKKGELCTINGQEIGYSGLIIDSGVYPIAGAKKRGRKLLSEIRNA